MPAQTFIEELNMCSECLVTLRERISGVFVDGLLRRVSREGRVGKHNEVSVMTCANASAAKTEPSY